MTDQAEIPHPSAQWRSRLLDAMLAEAAFSGWTRISFDAAAKAAGLTIGQASLAAPRGPVDLLDLFEDQADAAMLANAQSRSNSLRGRVKALVMARYEYMRPHREALRRAVAPALVMEAPARMWRSADRIWKKLNDTSADGSFYSKRVILTGVLSSGMLVFLADETPDLADTEAFVARRLDDVMAFEKIKASAIKAMAPVEGLLNVLAKARYGR